MLISKPEFFHLKIEDVKYRRNDDGSLSFSEWTGYGPIQVPFSKKKVYLKRGTRKPKFSMQFGKTRVLQIDLTEYLKIHLNYLNDKEETNNLITTFDDFELKLENLFTIDNTIKKHEKLIINSVIEYMKSKFDFDSKIIVKKKQNPNFFGDIPMNSDSIKNNKFTLHFNPNSSYQSMIKSLLHELTHIKQISKGELKPSPDYKSLIWKNDYEITVREYKKLMASEKFQKYKLLPWENEAYSNMQLIDDFLKSKYWFDLKGKDDNLDFIMGDII